MVRRTTLVCLWAQAVILGAIGVYLLWAHGLPGAWPGSLMVSTGLLSPIVFQALLLQTYMRSEKPGGDLSGEGRGSNKVWRLILSVAMYLPLMIFMESDEGLSGVRWALRWTSALPFLSLVLSFACLRGWLPIESSDHSTVSRGRNRWLESTARFFVPEVVLLLGVFLLAVSLWNWKAAIPLLSGTEKWITAEYGLGERIVVADVVLRFLGRLVYSGSLIVAAGTVVWLGLVRHSDSKLTSRLAGGLGIGAGVLGIGSITDYYFSWLSYLLEHDLTFDRLLFTLLLLHWAVPVLLVPLNVRGGCHREKAGPALRALIFFYAPLLLFDLAMTPFFAGDWDTSFFLTSFLGLQLLAWGYLNLVLARKIGRRAAAGCEPAFS